MQALPSSGRSLTLSPLIMFDVGAGVFVRLCVFMPACAGAVPPRSAVASSTRRRASESPHRGEACCRLFCAGVNVVAGTQGVRALPSVGRFLTQFRRHACLTSAAASASACVCVHACVRGRSYATVGGGWHNTAKGK